jgi:hypothetical protein
VTTNRVFDRYAQVRHRLDQNQATPKSILLDFDDTFADFAGADQDDPAAAITDLEYNDLCSDFDAGGNFHIALASKTYPCNVAFNMRRP